MVEVEVLVQALAHGAPQLDQAMAVLVPETGRRAERGAVIDRPGGRSARVVEHVAVNVNRVGEVDCDGTILHIVPRGSRM